MGQIHLPNVIIGICLWRLMDDSLLDNAPNSQLGSWMHYPKENVPGTILIIPPQKKNPHQNTVSQLYSCARTLVPLV